MFNVKFGFGPLNIGNVRLFSFLGSIFKSLMFTQILMTQLEA